MGYKAKAAMPALVFGLAFIGSVAYGSPARLPGAALGWSLLLHVERASAVLAILGAVWLVGWRALHGRFPIKFGHVEYEDELAASAATVEAHERRLKLIEGYLPPEQPRKRIQ